MSLADKIFISNCKQILNYGTTTEGQKNRPHWADGTPAYTVKSFGIVNRYDLRKEFPALTLRRTAIKSAMDEILWIYQKKSNNINDLNSHIWDEWADDDGSIGKAYGYQVGRPCVYRKLDCGLNYIIDHESEFSPEIVSEVRRELEVIEQYPQGSRKVEMLIDTCIDQMDALLYDLRNFPFSRRHMITLWNPDDLHEMNLQPCCWAVNFSVTEEGGNLVLNMMLHQRSQDVLTANNWNVVQYSLLLMMVAQCVGMVPGELVHTIADAHIYDRHIPIIRELIMRPEYTAPTVTLNPEIKDFYKFTTRDITVSDYKYSEFDYEIPIAV